jgi:peptide deformylase
MLRVLAKEVKEIDLNVQRIIDNMLETMYSAPGVGLAAPQVGVPLRIIVLDITALKEKPNPIVLINPNIIQRQDEIQWEEGCLSFPGIHEKIKRNARIQVTGLTKDGSKRTILADNLLAVVLQHEIDHLNGVLFIDHMSIFKRRQVIKEMRKR